MANPFVDGADWLRAFDPGYYQGQSTLTSTDLLRTVYPGLESPSLQLPEYGPLPQSKPPDATVSKLNKWFGTPEEYGVTDGKKVLEGDVAGGTTWGSDFFKNFQDYFLRGVIIILGFIFVGVGLSMFKAPIVKALTK